MFQCEFKPSLNYHDLRSNTGLLNDGDRNDQTSYMLVKCRSRYYGAMCGKGAYLQTRPLPHLQNVLSYNLLKSIALEL